MNGPLHSEVALAKYNFNHLEGGGGQNKSVPYTYKHMSTAEALA